MYRSIVAAAAAFVLVLVLGAATATASGVRLIYGSWVVRIDDPTWMNTSPPFGLGLAVGKAELSVVALQSDVLNSQGEGFRLRVRTERPAIVPYIEFGVDHYPRSNTGGLSWTVGADLWRSKGWHFGLVATQGWTEGRVSVRPSLTWEQRI